VPELVEVELSRRLAENLSGRRAETVTLVDPHASAFSQATLAGALEGATFLGPRRQGKLLLLDTDASTLGMHFGMTGRLVVDGRAALDRLLYAPETLGTRWLRFVVLLADGGRLELHDPRRLARVSLNPNESHLGPDAATITAAQLRSALGVPNARAPLKARLLDQRRLAGVGNLICDEVLWRAGLSPERPAGTLDDHELRRLAKELRGTIDRLLADGGSHTGELVALRVPDSRCPRDGDPMRRSTVGGRTTYWCPAHQR
jgi:formamidopyrimidine-DNA glycosylase